MRVVSTVASFLMFALAAPQSASASAESWHQWGGANRDNIVNESSGWNGSAWDIREIWERSDVGKGHTSPLIANVNGTWCVITMGWANDSGGTDYVRCINAVTGVDVWMKSYACSEYGAYGNPDYTFYGGPHSTPLYDAGTGYVYTVSTKGDLYYWDAHNGGTQMQHVDLRSVYGIDARQGVHDNRDYGFTCAPLMVGDDIVLDVGDGDGTTKTLLALDKTTAAFSWQSDAGDARGTTTGPVPMSGNRLAVLSDDNLLIMDAGTRATLASYAWNVWYGCDIATPAVYGDYVMLTAEYNQSRTVYVHVNGASATDAWGAASSDFAMVSTPVLYDGYGYLVDGSLYCLDLADGSRTWSVNRNLGVEGSCLVTATDGKLVVWGGNKLELFDTGAAMTLLDSKTSVLSSIWNPYAHVALGGGYYVVKDGNGRIACYGPPATAPVVVNTAAESILSTSARLCGQLTDDGGESATVTVYYGVTDGGTNPSAWDDSVDCGSLAAGSFGDIVTSLTPDTPYYYRAHAQNSAGEDWADAAETFVTLLTDPPGSSGSGGGACVGGSRGPILAVVLLLGVAALTAMRRRSGAV